MLTVAKLRRLSQNQEELRREQVRIEKNSERLVTAYQEGLVTLPQLRQRMPVLQKQVQAVGSELQSLQMAAVDQAKYLQLAESLGGFPSVADGAADNIGAGCVTQTKAALMVGTSGAMRVAYAKGFKTVVDLLLTREDCDCDAWP